MYERILGIIRYANEHKVNGSAMMSASQFKLCNNWLHGHAMSLIFDTYTKEFMIVGQGASTLSEPLVNY